MTKGNLFLKNQDTIGHRQKANVIIVQLGYLKVWSNAQKDPEFSQPRNKYSYLKITAEIRQKASQSVPKCVKRWRYLLVPVEPV